MRLTKPSILILTFLLAVGTANAGLVSRPSKTCGQTTYVGEVAAGCVTIKSSEVDADINAIITGGVNNIETANINAAGLGTNAIANLAVTTGKLAVGATVNTAVRDPEPPTTGWTPTTTASSALEVTLDSTAITTRGGTLLIFASLTGLTVNDTNTFTVRIKVDGALINVTNFQIVDSDGTTTTNAAVSIAGVATGIAAGAHTITVTGQCSIANISCDAASGAGRTQIVELG